MNIFNKIKGLLSQERPNISFVKSDGIDDPFYISQDTKKTLKVEGLLCIRNVCRLGHYDYSIIRAICEHESRLNPLSIRVEKHLRYLDWYKQKMKKYNRDPNQIIHTASIGLMQILFVNALPYIPKDITLWQLLGDPYLSLTASISFFETFRKRHGLRGAIQAWKAGHPTDEYDKEYTDKILFRYQQLQRQEKEK